MLVDGCSLFSLSEGLEERVGRASIREIQQQVVRRVLLAHAALLAIMLFAAAWEIWTSGWSAGLWLAVGIPFFGAICHAIAFPRALSRVLAGRGYCGSCTNSLASSDLDEDGRVTCPECGAGWRRKSLERDLTTG